MNLFNYQITEGGINGNGNAINNYNSNNAYNSSHSKNNNNNNNNSSTKIDENFQ